MSNEVRQAWQRFYAAALPALIAEGHGPQAAHEFAASRAHIAANYYATLIAPKVAKR